MASPVLITPPTIEPLHLAEAKAHLRVDFTTDDSLIAGYISSVITDVEGFLGRALLTSTWDQWFDDFPAKDYIELDNPPLQSVTSVKYYGTDDTENTMDAGDYFVDTKSFKGRVSLAYSKTWPSETLRLANGVVTRFVAGYTAYRGTVNTNGTAVTKATGSDFSVSWVPGKTIVINGVAYRIASVASTSSLVLETTAGTQTGVAYQTTDIPYNIVVAMLLKVQLLYDDMDPRKADAIKRAAESLLWMNRVVPV